MKKRSAIALVVAGSIFLILFVGRFIYELGNELGYAISSGQIRRLDENIAQEYFSGSGLQSKRNYASARIAIAQTGAPAQLLDQKYEQVASMSATSSDFEADARLLKEKAAAAGAIVQREDSYGLAGARSLSLSLGIVPAAFDATIDALRAIGKLESITVNKTDRTGDYRALEARRLSLEKTRDGLSALRRAGAALDDLVALETKILEIEGQIQELGVSLGDFSEGSSFCTVNASLRERDAGPAPRELLRALLEAFGWAALRTAALAIACLAAAGAAWLGGSAYAKIRDRERKSAATGQ